MTDKTADPEFPAAALPWIEAQLGGRISALQRMVVRREAWRVCVDDGCGVHRQGFLRIDRDGARGGRDPRGLERETSLIRFLCANTCIPTQQIIAWNDKHHVAIQSFEPGRADLHNASRAEQHDVMLHFMDIMADMHRIDVHGLELPGFEMPQTAEDHSLLELRAVDDPRLAELPMSSSTMLGAFGRRWLLNHVPRSVERTVLLQGDTGPGNFLFENHRVTAVVDWEWAHFGDPMEDVGNLWLRDFFTPSCAGDLGPYVRRYADRAGLRLDRQKAIYYLAHQLVRSVISLPRLVRRPHWRTTVALNLGYQAVCDITCADAIGLYHGTGEQASELLEIADRDPAGELFQVLAEQIEKGVVPHLEHAFARATAVGAAEIVRHLERLHLYGAQADQLELEGINHVLGARHARLAPARAAFKLELEQLLPADETPVLAHCRGVARRNMQLMGPLVQRWSGCRLATLN